MNVAGRSHLPDSKFCSLSYQQMLMILVTAIIWFSCLGYRDLIDPDEGRYAEIPREMVASADWLTPRLNDLKYFEKPAMHYWLTAAVYKVFDQSSGSARLVTAISGFMTALWCLFIASKLVNVRVGYYSYLVCISSMLFITLGHLITLDMTLTLFLSVAMGSLMLAQYSRDARSQCRNWMLIGYAALAAGTLTKGLVCLLLPGVTVVMYSVIFREWNIWRHLHLVKGVTLLLLLASPWFIWVSWVNPEFAEFFFIQEHLQRYTSTIHERSQPSYFFIPVLLLGLIPWSTMAITALCKPHQLLVNTSASAQPFFKPQGFSLVAFMWVFVVFTLIFFSLSHSKLVPYILPIVPFMAIFIAMEIDRRGLIKYHALQLVLLALLLGGASALLPYIDAGDIPKEPAAIASFQTKIWLACGVFLFGSLLCYRLRVDKLKSVSACAITSLLGFQLLSLSYQDIAQYNSAKSMALTMAPILSDDPELPLYSIGTFSHSLPFYLKRSLTLVDYQGELSMGIAQESHKALTSVAQFVAQWHALPQAIAVIDTRLFASELMQSIPHQVIYTDAAKVVIIKS